VKEERTCFFWKMRDFLREAGGLESVFLMPDEKLWEKGKEVDGMNE
jgi:hypothetical protein